MFEQLRNPEYLHVLLNPLPVYGLLMGVLALLAALITRARAARIVALSLIFLAAIAAWPAAELGEKAYDGVLAMSDEQGSAWLRAHMERAERVLWIIYAAAGLAAVSLLAERFAPRAALPLALGTLLVASGALVAGGYIAKAGGRIRHKEFRYEPAPELSTRPQDER